MTDLYSYITKEYRFVNYKRFTVVTIKNKTQNQADDANFICLLIFSNLYIWPIHFEYFCHPNFYGICSFWWPLFLLDLLIFSHKFCFYIICFFSSPSILLQQWLLKPIRLSVIASVILIRYIPSIWLCHYRYLPNILKTDSFKRIVCRVNLKS